MDINKAIESLWTMIKPQIATTIRGCIKFGAGAVGLWGGLKAPGSQEQFLDIGTAIALGLIAQGWSWWVSSGQKFAKAYVDVLVAKTLAQAQALRMANQPPVTVKQIAQQSNLTLEETAKIIPALPTEVQVNIAPSPLVPPAAKAALVLALLLGAMAWPGDASAAPRQAPAAQPQAAAAPAPAITGNAVADLTNLLKKIVPPPVPTTPDEIDATKCDFSIFSKLTFTNVVPLLTKCAQMVDQNTAAPLVADAQHALDSAKAFNNGAGDGQAIACLTPALALLKAAEGFPVVKDAAGNVTTPAEAPGIFLIGQKLREFVEAGGPSNCKAVVTSTMNGLTASALSL